MLSTWSDFLAEQATLPYWAELTEFLRVERANGPVYPSEREQFRALELTPLRDVKVAILGQDPYHGPGQVDGLAFSSSVPPPSLLNIFKELAADLPHALDDRTRRCITSRSSRYDGDLSPWAKQGVLLLNTALTVRGGKPSSHAPQWREFVANALRAVVNGSDVMLHFVLWGKPAQKLVEGTFSRLECPNPAELPWFYRPIRHNFSAQVSAHPSPHSASKFFGTRPFSRANEALELTNPGTVTRIDWSLP